MADMFLDSMLNRFDMLLQDERSRERTMQRDKAVVKSVLKDFTYCKKELGRIRHLLGRAKHMGRRVYRALQRKVKKLSHVLERHRAGLQKCLGSFTYTPLILHDNGFKTA